MRALLFIIGMSMSLGLSAQCYMDRHNTNWHDAWVSCQTDMSPNTSRGLGHWIMYDLGYTYILGDIHVWNINDPDLDALHRELERLGVPQNHYSLGRARDERTCLMRDGNSWITFFFERGRMEDVKRFTAFEEARAEVLSLLQP